MKAVLKYPGAKWRISEWIIAHFPEHKVYCEPFFGGGAFSGKDPSKVDRSAAYMANYIARDLVKNHGLKSCEVQIAYAIGESTPMSVSVKSSSPVEDAYFARLVEEKYDLSPAGIIKYLDLLNVDYEKLAEGCHYRMELPKRGASK